jgi:hypothetical protein
MRAARAASSLGDCEVAVDQRGAGGTGEQQGDAAVGNRHDDNVIADYPFRKIAGSVRFG